MKLGILGAGMIVREFLPWLTGPESPFKVEALCSTERSAGAAQALCDQYGVPRHTTSYDELLGWVDVVYIAVPNILHVKYTRAALEAGRHVIVEKPMAPTAARRTVSVLAVLGVGISALILIRLVQVFVFVFCHKNFLSFPAWALPAQLQTDALMQAPFGI